VKFTFDDLVAVMAHLRSPQGCPWDRDQTHASLSPYLLEEAHEVLDAIAAGNPAELRDELGDLLLQIVFHAQMAREAGTFDAAAVVDGLVHKLLDRHPHVFGDLRLGTPAEVKTHWEELKRRERPDRDRFAAIPASLPALARAQKLIERAAPPAPADRPADAYAPNGPAALADAREALDALTPATPDAAAPPAAESLGRLLFAVAVLAQASGVDAESALRQACDRFVAEARSAPRTQDKIK
jgi:MazG family protein